MPIVARRTAAEVAAREAADQVQLPVRTRVRKTPVLAIVQDTAPAPQAAPEVDEGTPLTPSKKDDYVGYKNPPKDKQFKKGQSGNLKGRPRGAKGLKTLARERLTEKVVVKTAAGPKRLTRLDAMMLTMIDLAFAGNIRAMQFCLTLYQSAVPDELPRTPAQDEAVADMDAHDEAILAALHETLLARGTKA